MSPVPRIWMRSEQRATEHRAPIVPADAANLVARGCELVVEDSPHRLFPAGEYAAAGATIVPAGTWPSASVDTFVLGIKELPPEPAALRHTHIFFSHSFKGQPGAAELLGRFAAGGGTILDLEYLTDVAGRRLAAFGYWAGYVGASLAVLHRRGRLPVPLTPTARAALDAALERRPGDAPLRGLVIGALGRCGSGAGDALRAAGVEVTGWDLAETRDLDRVAIRAHDLLVNAVLVNAPAEPFVTDADVVDASRRLSVIADVTCDVGSPHHLIPVYAETTSWAAPVVDAGTPHAPLDVIGIDNLPSLLPREASAAFSADLTPLLARLDTSDEVWHRCRSRFVSARDTVTAEVSHV
ncbi:saccharopine dehydrogenase [Actinoplanes sp. NPDC020271]|uniref:saccharopine dehydrogenase n=1 Tax=Actinoplanes sp. NPDC020271 TaxID=3363896 RepID=UPI0037A5E445